MRRSGIVIKIGLVSSALIIGLAPVDLFAADSGLTRWKISDRNRPLPRVITPGTSSTPQEPGRAPSDGVVLFDGKDLSKWESNKGGAAQWKVVNGAMEVAPGTGDIHTKQAFGDCQLHVEWAEPNPPHDKDQGRGNSGIYLMSRYELQVLDSYENTTYADGQAGAIYAQFPPLVNACRPPGEWQSYDIVFHGPRFAAGGKLLRPARITVLQNGVLVQDNVELTGPTDYMKRPPYAPHPEKMPLLLQDHDQPVRFRNIWIRELGE
ncbi:MAG TPA: DUF1080 domain-containing protein [Bryobacteraceae bacterium]|nr:DUF1080 domain-containing protein [Bryobacteraceae bacterium]